MNKPVLGRGWGQEGGKVATDVFGKKLQPVCSSWVLGTAGTLEQGGCAG